MSAVGKLTFPTYTAAYGYLGKVRMELQKMASWIDSPPRTDTGAVQIAARKLALALQLKALTNFLGWITFPPATMNAAGTTITITGVVPSGSYTSTVTMTFSATTGNVGAIVLS